MKRIKERLKGKALKPYIAYSLDPSFGSVLVFARDSQEARAVSWRYMKGILSDNYFKWRVRLIPKKFWKYFYEKEAIPELLKESIPHVIDNPRTCKICGYWGIPLDDDGICINCKEKAEGTD